MVRIVVEGPALNGFVVGEFTDHYVKCRFGESTRTYTVRDWDANRQRLTLDFIVHGEAGIAGPWAATARRGDTLALTGPGGGYAPSPDVDWHLMVGDEAVIPAIAVSLDRINPDVPVFVVLEVGGPEDEQPLRSPGDLRLQWLHRTLVAAENPDLQLQAVHSIFPRAVGKRSSTARPRPSCASAATYSKSAASTETTYPRPDTGS
jgi:NADPH-dependent ferric siderophore reductase